MAGIMVLLVGKTGIQRSSVNTAWPGRRSIDNQVCITRCMRHVDLIFPIALCINQQESPSGVFFRVQDAGADVVLGAWVQEEPFLGLQKVRGSCKGRGGAMLGALVQKESFLDL